MPVMIDYRVCDDSSACSAIRYCPNGTLSYDHAKGKVVVDSSKCVDGCSAVCTKV